MLGARECFSVPAETLVALLLWVSTAPIAIPAESPTWEC